MSDDLTIHSRSGDMLDVTYKGKRVRVGFSTTDPALLRKAAHDAIVRAHEDTYRALRTMAIAEALEAEAAFAQSAAAEQRRSRAAATRAHNRDPFGFGQG